MLRRIAAFAVALLAGAFVFTVAMAFALVSLLYLDAALGPWREWGTGLIMILVLMAALFGSVVFARGIYTGHARPPAPPSGMCQSCGYNLTGNTSGICPECGTPVEK